MKDYLKEYLKNVIYFTRNQRDVCSKHMKMMFLLMLENTKWGSVFFFLLYTISLLCFYLYSYYKSNKEIGKGDVFYKQLLWYAARKMASSKVYCSSNLIKHEWKHLYLDKRWKDIILWFILMFVIEIKSNNFSIII